MEKSVLLTSFALVSLTVSMVLAAPPAAKTPVKHEYIEWCNIWVANANRSDKPRVLLVGDSITNA